MNLENNEVLKDCFFHSAILFVIYFTYQHLVLCLINKSSQDYYLDISAAFRISGIAHHYSYLSFHHGFYIALIFYILESLLTTLFSKGGLENPVDNLTTFIRGDKRAGTRIIFQVFGSLLASKLSLFLWNSYYAIFSWRNYSKPLDVKYFMCVDTPASFLFIGFYHEFFSAILRKVVLNFKTANFKNRIGSAFFNVVVLIKGYIQL